MCGYQKVSLGSDLINFCLFVFTGSKNIKQPCLGTEAFLLFTFKMIFQMSNMSFIKYLWVHIMESEVVLNHSPCALWGRTMN